MGPSGPKLGVEELVSGRVKGGRVRVMDINISLFLYCCYGPPGSGDAVYINESVC